MKNQLIAFQKKGDERGGLVVLENYKEVPFEIKRVYYLFGTKQDIRRGFHAHYNLQQLAVCVAGNCSFLMDDGYSTEIIKLTNNHTGLMINPLIWHEMFNFSTDCVLMVLASDYYEENDYIRNYQDFVQVVTEKEL